jgi:hypothetical protein
MEKSAKVLLIYEAKQTEGGRAREASSPGAGKHPEGIRNSTMA